MPPISSHTMSTSGWRTTTAGSLVRLTPAMPRVPSRARSSVRVAIHVMRIGRPARRVISSSLRRRTSHVPRPTVPKPSRPTLSGFIAGRSLSLAKAVVAEHLLDAADRLARARLVLDHREAHVPVAVLAEADARRHRHLGVGHQFFFELERPHRA